MNAPHIDLVDSAGATLDTPPSGVDVKQLFFNVNSVIAVAGLAITWATLAGDVRSTSREVERLRDAAAIRAQSDIRIAETMATKLDVQRVSDQVQDLAAELRRARGVP